MTSIRHAVPLSTGELAAECPANFFDAIESREALSQFASLPKRQRDALMAVTIGMIRRFKEYPTVLELSRRTGRSREDIDADAQQAMKTLRQLCN